MECHVRSVMYKVWSVKCGVWGVKSSGMHGTQSMQCKVPSVKCKVWSVKCGV